MGSEMCIRDSNKASQLLTEGVRAPCKATKKTKDENKPFANKADLDEYLNGVRDPLIPIPAIPYNQVCLIPIGSTDIHVIVYKKSHSQPVLEGKTPRFLDVELDNIPEYTEDTNTEKIDLHKNIVDKVVLTSPEGKKMYRESDLIDVWFDSGSMPYAQWHYPFENKEMIDKNIAFPADYIAEGVDQTRGWFYTLHTISSLVFDSISFKKKSLDKRSSFIEFASSSLVILFLSVFSPSMEVKFASTSNSLNLKSPLNGQYSSGIKASISSSFPIQPEST